MLAAGGDARQRPGAAWEAEPVGTVDLGAVVADALEVLEPQIATRRVRVDVATPLPSVPGQATKLGHVVGNLIGNAIRFVPEETGEIAVSSAREDGALVLSVRDNGVGIPAEYHETIFEMFRRVPDGDGGAGSGMGLAIVRRIVEGHGGRVWVESVRGAGCTFQVRLPVG
jgi:signal transduction histidine kinase